MIVFIFLYAYPFAISYSAIDEYLNFFRTDSAYVYNWNAINGEWIPASIQKYNYDGGRLLNVVMVSYTSRTEQAKVEYQYDVDGLLSSATNYAYNNGWLPSIRNLYSYDSQSRISEIRVQKISGTDWVDDRLQLNYVYDAQGKVTEFQMIYWRNDQWTLPTTDHSYYDSNNKLIRREATYSTGITDYQIIYTYDLFNLLSEMYAQYPSSGSWNNLWKTDYQYNPCGLKISQVQYAGSGSSWIPNTLTVNYTYFKPDLCPEKKLPMCHNGKTIIVKKTVVQNRLDHGDCLGPCADGKGSIAVKMKSGVTEQPAVPFTIYPVPATDHITVARNGYDSNISKVELIDMYGHILRSEIVSDDGEVVIPRNGLISGQYLVRIHGDQVYSMIIIFN